MISLSKLLRVKIILLQQTQTPQQMGLGDFCSREECTKLLTFLHQCWCECDSSRFGQRRAITTPAQLCYTLESIYAHLSGKAFSQSSRGQSVDTASRRQIETFGRVLNDESASKKANSLVLESWQFEDECISGARLLRNGDAQARISYNQLIAVKPENATAFMLGTIAWAMIIKNGRLKIGVRYLPGAVDVVRIRATGINLTISEKYVPGWVLHAVPALTIPTSLIVPRGWFQSNRVVEALYQNGETQHLKMGFSVEQGLDYERVSFTLVKLA